MKIRIAICALGLAAGALPVCARAEMASSNAVIVVLNLQNAVSAKTFAEAKAVLERDAAAGRPLQQFVVGVTTDDKKLAKKYLEASRPRIKELAERNDNPFAWYLLSMENNDLNMLRKAADGGNVQALNALGTITTQAALARSNISSNALANTLRTSFDYFRKAAAQRDPNGFINLGACYLRGFGCRQDLAMAFSCFLAAAEMGHPEGMDNVSACYQFGHGVKKDSGLSLQWAMRGRAARGDEAAAKWLKERR